MCAQSASQENPAAELTPVVEPRMPWRVADVQHLTGYRLKVRFNDGLEGEADLELLVTSPAAGVFSVLTDPELFARVHLVWGAVTWPGEIDLAPDAMYRGIRDHGIWRPTA